MTTTKATPARQLKTPRQRAEQDLAVANRRVVTLERKTDRLKADLVSAERDLTEAIRLRDFLKQHPALPAEHRLDTTTPQKETESA